MSSTDAVLDSAAQQYADATDRVEGTLDTDGRLETTTVYFTWDVGGTVGRKQASVELSPSDWVKDSCPHAFRDQFNGHFYQTPRLSREEWQQLRRFWDAQQEVR